MYDPYLNIRQEQHSQDLLREARGNRLVNAARAESGRHTFYCGALTQLDRWLASLSARLVERYGAVPASPSLQSLGLAR